MADFLSVEDLEWQAVRPALTAGVSGRTLLDGATKAVLTRVAPGGGFSPHSDAYGHLFYVLEGRGRISAGGEDHEVGPGSVVRVPAGEVHGYVNAGTSELFLLSLNLPQVHRGE